MTGPLLIILCSILWATDAIFRVPLANHVPSSMIVFIEHVFCVLITFPLFFIRRGEVKNLKLKGWTALAFIGVMGSAFGLILFTLSYKYINPSVTILLQKLQPIIAIVAARVLLNERPKKNFYIFATIALLSSTMISAPELWNFSKASENFAKLTDGLDSSQTRIKGILFALGAAFSWGLSTVFGRWISQKVTFPVTTFLRFSWALAALFLLMVVEVSDAKLPVRTYFNYFLENPVALRSILYMALISGVSAMYLYYAGLRRTKASVATFCELAFPVAALIINWKVLGHTLIPIQILGATTLMISILAITKKTN